MLPEAANDQPEKSPNERAAANGVRLRDVALIAYARGPEHPSKIRLLRWLVHRLAAGEIRVRYAPNTVIAIDPSDYIGWAIFRTGAYERASIELALRLMRRQPGLFVDVGAHCGLYSCAVAAIAGTAVVAIEPDCANCVAFKRNLALNGRRHVIVFNGAVGETCEPVRIAARARTNSGTVAIISEQAVQAPCSDCSLQGSPG